jgi:uncharacterized protein YkwD
MKRGNAGPRRPTLPGRRLLAGILLALVPAAVPAGPCAHAASRPAASRTAPDAAAVAISRLRSAQGLGKVTSDPVLQRAARHQAEAMARAGTMSHDVAGSFSSRLASVGVKAGRAAENIAAGQNGLGQVLADWMQSSGHRANMMMRDATRVGLARAAGPGGPFWALVIATPEPVQRPTDTAPRLWPTAPF